MWRVVLLGMSALMIGVASGVAEAQPITGNLVASNVQVSPSPASSGQTVTLTFDVTNQGPGNGQMTFVDVLLNGATQQTFQTNFTFFNGQVRSFNAPATMPVVSPGSSTSVQVGVHIHDGVNASGDIASTFVTVNGPPRPDITFDTPTGWSGPVIVSSVTGTTSTVNPLPFGAPGFVDVAYRNTGGSMVAGGPGVQLEVILDGTTTIYNQPDSPMNSGDRRTRLDLQMPQSSLTPGAHTILLRLDGGNSIVETNENNNTFSFQFTVADPPRPNLAPFTPPGWSSSLIVSNVPGTTTSAPMTRGDTAYIDVGYQNNGNTNCGVFRVQLFMNGGVVGTFVDSGLATGATAARADLFQIPNIPGGNVTFAVQLDAFNEVIESNEGDNAASVTVPVAQQTCPTITTQPSSQATCSTGTAIFSVAASGTSPTYRWRIESPAGSGTFVDLGNPTFSEPSSGLSFGVSGAASSSLTLSGLHLGTHAPSMQLVAVASNLCGNATSGSAAWTVCIADFNCNSQATVQDIFDFLAEWFAGNPHADLGIPGISVQDIFDFLTAWFAGC